MANLANNTPIFWGPNGGKISIDDTSGSGNTFDVDVTDWMVDPNTRLTENTTTGSGGGTAYEKVVDDPQWSFSLPFDSANLLFSYLKSGGKNPPKTGNNAPYYTKYTLTFNLGQSTKTVVVTNTTLEKAELALNAKDDILRFKISGKGGTIQEPNA